MLSLSLSDAVMMEDTLSDLETAVLWAAIEGEAGLWELEWELNSVRRGLDRSDVRQVVQSLLIRGLISVGVARTAVAESKPVDGRQAQRLLEADEAWAPAGVEDMDVVRVNATNHGRALLVRE